MLNPNEAFKRLEAKYPFGAISDAERYLNLVRLMNLHAPGSRVLDFGSGPCDKTAMLSLCGYSCSAFDDLGDEWHRHGRNMEAIFDFARTMGVDLRVADDWRGQFEPAEFDVLMLLDVIEHLHSSPRELLEGLLNLVRPGGILFATIPNVANLRKRIDLLRGRTNMAGYDQFYWYPGEWRGHVREYSRGDCEAMLRNLGLEMVEVGGINQMLDRLPVWARGMWKAFTSVAPNLRDTWLVVGLKPADWNPMVYGDDELRHLGFRREAQR